MDSVGSINLFSSIALIVIVLTFVIRFLASRAAGDFKAPLGDVHRYMDALFAAPEKSFLIVNEKNSDGFIQMMKLADGTLIDFPVTSEPNRSKKPAFIAACQNHRLPLKDEKDTIQTNFTGNAEELSTLIRQLMAETFGVNDNTMAEYDWDGFKGPVRES